MGKPAVVVDNVSMKFNLSKEKVDNLKDYLIKFIKKEIKYNEFWALQNVNFEVQKGDRVGILGLNGAGKSTLLKVIAGVFKPTEGKVIKNGRLVPLLELGAGFDPQYTGRENIYLYGAMLGYSKSFIEEKFDEIVEFSELKEFIDVPIKNYSSGMKARLGFSIATLISPDILILDEVLSVGDAKFRKKSEKKVLSMFDKGVTVLFVSHSLQQVQRLCNKAMILEKGKLIAYGDIDEISEKYENKRIKRDCKALMKKCSAKSSRDMNTLVELIDLMYIYQDFEMAVELYHIIEKVEFTGNYTIYDEILYAKWTIVRIYRETNQTEKYEQLLNSVMEYENEALYDNRKAGLKLYDEHIRNARDLKAKQSMIGWMLVKYKIMIKCFENPKFPIDKIKLDKEIVEMEMKLKNIL